MSETDKQMLAVWKAYFAEYSKFYDASCAYACATSRANDHEKIRRLELEVRLAEAKSKIYG